MDVILSYDVNDMHDDVKRAMKEKGYYEYKQNNRNYYIPSTLLWQRNTPARKAISDLKSVAETLEVNVDRVIALNCKSVAKQNFNKSKKDCS